MPWRPSGRAFVARELNGDKGGAALTGQGANCFAFSPDRAVIASVGDNKMIRLWDAKR